METFYIHTYKNKAIINNGDDVEFKIKYKNKFLINGFVK